MPGALIINIFHLTNKDFVTLTLSSVLLALQYFILLFRLIYNYCHRKSDLWFQPSIKKHQVVINNNYQ